MLEKNTVLYYFIKSNSTIYDKLICFLEYQFISTCIYIYTTVRVSVIPNDPNDWV